ncbi:hypothetical protein TRFO_35002 [Tritrichomonas foetus]|uniref:Beige/BEACH domain containing protein n=1 Tax=Tritrichomonas foetus TaxID=1144522 RepID=A0A1J4JJ33_9EUKA|nr:hypothetical protein TRFO_35002 [Tritrichomonas foetus]|eukprot:OHS98601.1 hypothetical protein TRFO_35002 [Tritrichomonas foetus]
MLKWIDIFTSELPHPEEIQLLHSVFGNILNELPVRSFTTESIYTLNEEDETDQKKFLETLFELDKPIDPIFWDFALKILEHETELSGAPKVWKFIYPYLMRFFVHYNYQFNARANNFFNNPNQSDALFIHAHFLIPLIFLFSQADLNDIILCLSDFFKHIRKLLFTTDKYLSNNILKQLADEIFASCHALLTPVEIINNRYSLPIELIFEYFNSHCSIFGTDDLSPLELQFLIQALALVPRIDIDFFHYDPETFVEPLICGAAHVLSMLHTVKIPKTMNDAVFNLGISILSTYTHLCKIGIGHIFNQTQHTLGYDISYFILWCFDCYQLNKLSFHSNYHDMHAYLIPSELTSCMKIPVLPDYTFIDTPTFSNPVKTVSQLNEETSSIHEFKFLTDFKIPDCIISNHQIYKLIGTILNLLQSLSEPEINYLKKFVSISLEILNDLFKYTINNNSDLNYDLIDHNLALSYLFFLICIFNQCKADRICAVFVEIPDGFSSLVQPIIFSPLIHKWNTKEEPIEEQNVKQNEEINENEIRILNKTEKDLKTEENEKNEYFEFIFQIRKLLIYFLSSCFRVSSMKNPKHDFDKERVTFQILSTLYARFIDSSPQIFDEIIPLILDFIHVNVDFFIQTANHTGIFEMLMKHMFDNQILHICLKDNHDYDKYLPKIEKSRFLLFRIFDDFLQSEGGKIFFFGNQQFVHFLVHFLFEAPVSYFAADLLKRCVMLNADSINANSNINQFKIIFRNISELIKSAIGNAGDIRWIKLMLVIMETMKDAFAINRNTIFSYLKSQQVLLLLSRLPLAVVRANPSHFVIYNNDEITDEDIIISETDTPYMKIIEYVFDIFIILSRENTTFAESLASSSDSYYENITQALKMIKFGASLVDRLLTLVFENSISISNLPTIAQIRNYHALPFLFNSTTHLPYHSKLIQFIALVCNDSVSNKLRVFQAHLPDIIIDYLQIFPTQMETNLFINDSIAESLHLFSIVSQYVFSVPTLFRCIQAMRLKDGMRVWWTGQLLSLFSTYIENSAKSSPCAFFYLDGRHTGFFLPEIPSSLLYKGWSFMCRFELDSFGTNIGKTNASPALLYLKFANGDSFSISFEKSKLKLSFVSASNSSKSWTEIIEKLDILSNTWYDLIFSSDFTLYVSCNYNSVNINNANHKNGNNYYLHGRVFTISLKHKFDLKQGIVTSAIGNVPPRAASEAPLVANISAFYFFTGTISNDTASLLLSLPLSFVFGFSPSELKLDPRLPAPLFNDDFDSRLFLGINARMTDGSTCFNIAKRSDIQSITFRGVAFPFSTSFVDITNYSGGVKLFLPLFDQVSLKMFMNEERKDNSSFLIQLISMIQSFFQRSKSLEADFVRSDGFKAIAHSLMKIHPQFFTRTVLCSLFSMCTILQAEFRSIMIDDIWLNFNIWKQLSEDIQIYLYTTIFTDLKKSYNFREHVVIGELCAVIAEQPVEALRKPLWELLKSMAEISFSNYEQDTLFSFLFLKNNVPFQLEALQTFYDLCKSNINDCCSVFRRHNMFTPFLQLLHEPIEKVRILSLRIIFLVFHSVNLLPDHFDAIILKVVHQISHEGVTDDTWRTIQSLAFHDELTASKDLRFVIPIACSCSHYFEADKLQLFQISLKSCVVSSQAAAKSVTDCSVWYFWLLYFTMQSAKNKYNFSKRKYDAKTFGPLIEYMAQNDKIDEPIFFFEWLCYSKRWNTMPFINIIMRECISSIKTCSVAAFNNIVFEVFRFVYYIHSKESFSSNVQLYSEHNQKIHDDLLSEIDSCISLDEYMKINSNFIQQHFVFSMRITEDGKWLDKKLAMSIISFMARYTDRSMATAPFSKIQKTKLSEIFSFFVSTVVQIDPSSIREMLGHIKQYFNQKIIDSVSLKILTTAFVNISLRASNKDNLSENEPVSEKSTVDSIDQDNNIKSAKKLDKSEITTILNRFYKSNSSMVNGLSVDFDDFNFCRNILQEYGPDIALWLENIQSFSQSVTDLYKTRYSNYFSQFQETVNKYNQPYINNSYTSEMDDNISSLKRKQRRNKSLAAKVFRRITRELTVNGGPWCDNEIHSHWKLSPRTDAHFRHLFVRPNWHFDVHRGASLRRDQAKNEQAKLEYQRWIEMQMDDQVSTDFSLEDVEDQLSQSRLQYQFSATMITIAAVYDGSFSLNKNEICFDGVQVKDEYLFSIEGNSSKTVEFKLNELVWVLHRSYLHIDRGLEFFCKDGRSYFFYFSLSDRNQIIKILSDFRLPNLITLQKTSSNRCFAEQHFTEKWLNKEMSTYDYLMTVNLFAGRSFHDLSQYPVFPWILADYESEKLDLNKPETFRDLS